MGYAGNGRRFVLGVDGGNTKTVAVVADVSGEVVGVARGGCSDIYGAASLEIGLAELASTVRAALDAASIAVDAVASCVLSLAGADWPEDIRVIADFARRELGLGDVVVVNDAIGGLRSGTDDGVGVSVICGTFNAIGARNEAGQMFHLGFWPDRTGAIDLSTEALKAVYREGLGVGPTTALTGRALALFRADTPLDLLHSFTRREARMTREELVRMTPVVLDVADEGDPVARAIVCAAGRALGTEAACSARQIGLPLDGTAVVLSGGVLQHPTTLLSDEIMQWLPGARALRCSMPPIVGAVMLACDWIGLTSDASHLSAGIDRYVAG